jgi:ABC-type Zn uptake system ZnuABC Zn-binding protein ZnuA
MLRAIEQRLSTLLPEQQAYFAQRRVEFSKRLEAKEREWQALLASYHGKQLLGYHDSWPYLMEFLALRMQYFIEPKPGISPSPKHLEQLQEQMRSNQIGVIVQESFYPIQAASSLAKTSAAQILLLCQNVAQRPECADYIAMMDFNIRSIAEALS